MTLKKVYEDGEKFELMLLKEMAEEFKKEKLIKDSIEQGSKISDKLSLKRQEQIKKSSSNLTT